jgi:hypothetical protein
MKTVIKNSGNIQKLGWFLNITVSFSMFALGGFLVKNVNMCRFSTEEVW